MLTIEQFAKKHRVSKEAIRFHIRNKTGVIKTKLKYGVVLIDDKKSKYKPVRGRGRKCTK